MKWIIQNEKYEIKSYQDGVIIIYPEYIKIIAQNAEFYQVLINEISNFFKIKEIVELTAWKYKTSIVYLDGYNYIFWLYWLPDNTFNYNKWYDIGLYDLVKTYCKKNNVVDFLNKNKLNFKTYEYIYVLDDIQNTKLTHTYIYNSNEISKIVFSNESLSLKFNRQHTLFIVMLIYRKLYDLSFFFDLDEEFFIFHFIINNKITIWKYEEQTYFNIEFFLLLIGIPVDSFEIKITYFKDNQYFNFIDTYHIITHYNSTDTIENQNLSTIINEISSHTKFFNNHKPQP